MEILERHYGERYKWFFLVVMALGSVSGVLASASFNVAIPAMMRHFHLVQSQAQWVVTGFMAAMTVAMLPTHWLLHRLGIRRVFLLCMALLAVGSALGVFAPNFLVLVGARILQGVAAGILQPLGYLVVMQLFPSGKQGRASGILSFGVVLAPAMAPALGGVLLDGFGWQAIFFLNVPFFIMASVLGLYILPRPQKTHARRFDWTGLVLTTLATLALVEAIANLQTSGPAAPWTLGNLLVAALALAAFIHHGRRAEAPLISLGLFRNPTFCMGAIVSFAYGFGLYASTYLIPVFLQSALGFSAAAAGTALLPGGLALAASIPFAGRLADHYPPKWITAAGLALFAFSFLLFAGWNGHITWLEIALVTVMGRIGLALILPSLNLATLRHLEAHHLAQSSVVISYTRQVGGVLGIAIVAVFVGWREHVHGFAPPGVFSAYAQGFLLLALVFVAALIAACRMKGQ
ncbi:MAG: DHA2 family efflux MFS transporter permease subunit [Zoogloeaceae bacterium]|jgi:EmrB/QacA subfamily drug resistance transporter|nr:DHA2 family efflux MFS transporter permease subunit [Zoogloeaceae bacterium]